MSDEPQATPAQMAADQIRGSIRVLEAYLRDAANRRDWHAVSDAANDLRVLEVRLELFAELAGGGL